MLNLSHCVESYKHFCLLFSIFFLCPITKYGDVTLPTMQVSIILFCRKSSLNVWKKHKMSGGNALDLRSYQLKTSSGGPLVHLGLKYKCITSFSMTNESQRLRLTYNDILQ